MKPFWTLHNKVWSGFSSEVEEYPTKEAALKAALDLRNRTGLNFYIMQPIATTTPPPIDLELSKSEYKEDGISKEETRPTQARIEKKTEGEQGSSS